MNTKKKIMQDMVPAFEKFQPEVILLSAGFDAHGSDLMSGTNLSTGGYDFITEKIVDLVNTYAQGRVISILEGGYNLQILPVLVENHIKILAGIR